MASAEIGLKSERVFGCLPCLFTQGEGWLQCLCDVADRINGRQQRPTKSELRVQAHCFSEIFLCAKGGGSGGCSLKCVSQTTQVGIVGLSIVGRFGGDLLLFPASEVRPQLICYCFCDLALDRKDVGQFAIKCVGPSMRISGRFD